MADITAIAMRYADEVWNGKDLSVVEELFSSDHVYHDTLLPDLPTGPEGVRQRRGVYLAAMPDGHVTVKRLAAQGDIAAADWVFSGTNSGAIMGLPPTNRPATITGSHFFRFAGGLIAETWTYPDNLSLLQQLGLVTIGPAS